MKWFTNLKIGTKLLAGFVLVGLTTVWIGWTGLSALSRANQNSATMYKDRTVPIEDLGYANAALLALRGDAWRLAAQHEPAVRREMAAGIEENHRALLRYLDKYDQTYLTDQEKELLPKFRAAYERYHGICSQFLDLVSRGKEAEAGRELERARPVLDESRQLLRALIEVNAK
jgi:methyl-accepting chemotaxis protein